MKKYALLAGENYYPERGINDLIGFFDTIPDAVSRFGQGVRVGYEYDWGQIVDTATWKIEEELRS